MLTVKSGGGAAWRARYLYLNGHLLARVVLDPNGGTKPKLDVALPIGWCTSCTVLRLPRLAVLRFPLPYVPWSWCMRARYARPVVALYKASQRLYHGLDGRYGWGGSCKRASPSVRA